MSDDDTAETGDREFGIEFDQLRRDLEEHEYPTTGEALIEAYGDREIGVADGTETFEELIGPLGEESYESFEAVEEAMLNMVGDAAIGRKNYSDRTPYAVGEKRQREGAPGDDVDDEPESF